jgi:hypothetical protein
MMSEVFKKGKILPNTGQRRSSTPPLRRLPEVSRSQPSTSPQLHRDQHVPDESGSLISVPIEPGT